MNRILSALCLGASLALLTGCAAQTGMGAYKVTAYKPHNPANVRVKLSTSTQNLYVLEGDRLLMAARANVGTAKTPTPHGRFTIYKKEKYRRRQSQPDRGYPMAYWCEFKTAYGIHEGFVHPSPRTHGCVRLHREAAARLFALVREGTPLEVATSFPEDQIHGSKVRPLDQSKDPDPPRSLLMSPSWFQDPPGPLLIES